MTPIFDFLIRFRLGAIGLFLVLSFGPSLTLPGLVLPAGTLARVSLSAGLIYLVFWAATLSAYIALAPLISLAASLVLMHGLVGIVFEGSTDGMLLAISGTGLCGVVLSVRGAWRLTEGISMGHAARDLMASIVGDFFIFGAAAYLATLLALGLLYVAGAISIIPVLMTGIFAPLALAIGYGFLFPLIAGYEPSEEDLVAHYNRILRVLDPAGALAGRILQPNWILLAAAICSVATLLMLILFGGDLRVFWWLALLLGIGYALLAGLLGLSWRAMPPVLLSVGVVIMLGMIVGGTIELRAGLAGLFLASAVAVPVALGIYYEIMGRLKGGERLAAALDQAGVAVLFTTFGTGLVLLCAVGPWLWALADTRHSAQLFFWIWLGAPVVLLAVSSGGLILSERLMPRRETIRWTV